MTKSSLRIALLLGIFFVSSLSLANSWERYGYRWAIEKADQGEKLAIYDLSYPEKMGWLDIGELAVDPYTVKQIILAILQKNHDLEKNPKYQSKIHSALNDEAVLNTIYSEWWDNVPRKTKTSSFMANNELSFDNIDWTQLVWRQYYFQKDLNSFNKIWAELQKDEEWAIDPMEAFKFVKESTGSLSVSVQYLNTNTFAGPQKIKLHKIVDLKNPKWAFVKAVKWYALHKIADRVTRYIVDPTTRIIVGTAFAQFFEYNERVIRARQHMFLEALESIKKYEDVFPQEVLNDVEFKNSIAALSFAQSSMNTAWIWLWNNPYQEWLRELAVQDRNARQSTQWLVAKNKNTHSLSSRYAIEGNNKIYILSQRKPSEAGPELAVDFTQPHQRRSSRTKLDLMHIGVQIGTEFVPYVGSWLYDLFNDYVMAPYRNSLVWEARLTALLEQRMIVKGENWSSVLDQLDHQKINPFDPNRRKTDLLIQKRASLLGI